jgi:hypothetical protein
MGLMDYDPMAYELMDHELMINRGSTNPGKL